MLVISFLLFLSSTFFLLTMVLYTSSQVSLTSHLLHTIKIFCYPFQFPYMLHLWPYYITPHTTPTGLPVLLPFSSLPNTIMSFTKILHYFCHPEDRSSRFVPYTNIHDVTSQKTRIFNCATSRHSISHQGSSNGLYICADLHGS